MSLAYVTIIDSKTFAKDPERPAIEAIIICAYCEAEGKEPLCTQLAAVKTGGGYSRSLPKVTEWHAHNPCPVCKGNRVHKVTGNNYTLTIDHHCWGTGKDPSLWDEV